MTTFSFFNLTNVGKPVFNTKRYGPFVNPTDYLLEFEMTILSRAFSFPSIFQFESATAPSNASQLPAAFLSNVADTSNLNFRHQTSNSTQSCPLEINLPINTALTFQIAAFNSSLQIYLNGALGRNCYYALPRLSDSVNVNIGNMYNNPANVTINYLSLKGAVLASPCPGGYKCDGGSTAPVICTSGTFSVQGSSTCTPCAEGTFSSSDGARICQNCTAAVGSYCPSGSTNTVGVFCPSGYRCAGGSNPRVICSVGTYSTATASAGPSSCTNCNGGAGTYCPEGSTTSLGVTCTAGYSCVGGTSNRVICPIGILFSCLIC